MTALFVTGVNFNFILAIYFRYQYFFYLETGLFADRPADFLYCVLFVVLLLNVPPLSPSPSPSFIRR